MRIIRALRYWFQAWRWGKDYGCGRCHHGYIDHQVRCLRCVRCVCQEYSIERLSPWTGAK